MKSAKKKFSIQTKATAIFSSFLLALSQSLSYAETPMRLAVTEVKAPNPFPLNIPPELGKIETLFSGSGPTLVHIQTAHGNYEAQKKIQAILHYLKKQYGFNLLFLEGHDTKLDPSRLRFFPEDMGLTMKIADDLTRDALLKGENLFLLEDREAEAYGIEDLDAYVKNGQAFFEVLAKREQSEKFLRDLDLQIERRMSASLSAPLRSFLKTQERHENQTLPLMDWLSYLKTRAVEVLKTDVTHPRYQLDWPMLFRVFKLREFSAKGGSVSGGEAKFDMAAFEKERGEFLGLLSSKVEGGGWKVEGKGNTTRFFSSFDPRPSTFHQIANLLNAPLSQHQLPDPETGLLFEQMVSYLPPTFDYKPYPNVSLFIGHLILQSELKGDRLMEEMHRLADQISNELAETAEAKKVLALLKDYRLLKKLSALELTREEYSEVEGRRWKVEGKAGQLFESALTFYQWAKKRDSIMLHNIEKILTSQIGGRWKVEGGRWGERRHDFLLSSTLHPPPSTLIKAIVITGGFHAGPFTDHFRKAGYNYALISPKITATEGNESYIKAALQLGLNFQKRSAWQSPDPMNPKLIIRSELRRHIANRILHRAPHLDLKQTLALASGLRVSRSETRMDDKARKAMGEFFGKVHRVLKNLPGDFTYTYRVGYEFKTIEEWKILRLEQLSGWQNLVSNYRILDRPQYEILAQNIFDSLRVAEKRLGIVLSGESLEAAWHGKGEHFSTIQNIMERHLFIRPGSLIPAWARIILESVEQKLDRRSEARQGWIFMESRIKSHLSQGRYRSAFETLKTYLESAGWDEILGQSRRKQAVAAFVLEMIEAKPADQIYPNNRRLLADYLRHVASPRHLLRIQNILEARPRFSEEIKTKLREIYRNLGGEKMPGRSEAREKAVSEYQRMGVLASETVNPITPLPHPVTMAKVNRRAETRVEPFNEVPQKVQAVILSNDFLRREISVKPIRISRNFFREHLPVITVSEDSEIHRTESQGMNAHHDWAYRVRQEIYRAVQRFFLKINFLWLPKMISRWLWKLFDLFCIFEWNLSPNQAEYLNSQELSIKHNIHKALAALPGPVKLLLYPMGTFYKRWSRELSLGYGKNSKWLQKKLGGEVMAFRDESGRIHMPLDFFISDDSDAPFLQRLAIMTIRVAGAENQDQAETLLHQEARTLLFESDLFEFQHPDLVEKRLADEAIRFRPDLFLRLNDLWHLIHTDERLLSNELSDEALEGNLRRVLLEQIAQRFTFGHLLGYDVLYEMMSPWMPRRAIRIKEEKGESSLDITQVILNYVKNASIHHLEAFSVQDWWLALRHIEAALQFGVMREMYERLLREGIWQSPEEAAAVRERLAESRMTPQELFQKLFRDYDVLLFQTNLRDFKDFFRHLKKSGLSENTLIVTPIVNDSFDSVRRGRWTSVIHYKVTTWKHIAQSVNDYLRTGNESPFVDYYKETVAGARTMTDELKRELKPWKKWFGRSRKAPFIFFPDFGVNMRTEMSSPEQLAAAMRDYLVQLKEYAEATKASKIVLALPLESETAKEHLRTFQKPSRNTPDLWHSLLKTEKLLGEKNVTTVHVTYDFREDTSLAPLYATLKTWTYGSFGAPVHPLIADLPILVWPEPADPYVFGNFDYTLITVRHPPDDAKDEKPKAPHPAGLKTPEPDELMLVKNTLVEGPSTSDHVPAEEVSEGFMRRSEAREEFTRSKVRNGMSKIGKLKGVQGISEDAFRSGSGVDPSHTTPQQLSQRHLKRWELPFQVSPFASEGYMTMAMIIKEKMTAVPSEAREAATLPQGARGRGQRARDAGLPAEALVAREKTKTDLNPPPFALTHLQDHIARRAEARAADSPGAKRAGDKRRWKAMLQNPLFIGVMVVASAVTFGLVTPRVLSPFPTYVTLNVENGGGASSFEKLESVYRKGWLPGPESPVEGQAWVNMTFKQGQRRGKFYLRIGGLDPKQYETASKEPGQRLLLQKEFLKDLVYGTPVLKSDISLRYGSAGNVNKVHRLTVGKKSYVPKGGKPEVESKIGRGILWKNNEALRDRYAYPLGGRKTSNSGQIIRAVETLKKAGRISESIQVDVPKGFGTQPLEYFLWLKRFLLQELDKLPQKDRPSDFDSIRSQLNGFTGESLTLVEFEALAKKFQQWSQRFLKAKQGPELDASLKQQLALGYRDLVLHQFERLAGWIAKDEAGLYLEYYDNHWRKLPMVRLSQGTPIVIKRGLMPLKLDAKWDIDLEPSNLSAQRSGIFSQFPKETPEWRTIIFWATKTKGPKQTITSVYLPRKVLWQPISRGVEREDPRPGFDMNTNTFLPYYPQVGHVEIELMGPKVKFSDLGSTRGTTIEVKKDWAYEKKDDFGVPLVTQVENNAIPEDSLTSLVSLEEQKQFDIPSNDALVFPYARKFHVAVLILGKEEASADFKVEGGQLYVRTPSKKLWKKVEGNSYVTEEEVFAAGQTVLISNEDEAVKAKAKKVPNAYRVDFDAITSEIKVYNFAASMIRVSVSGRSEARSTGSGLRPEQAQARRRAETRSTRPLNTSGLAQGERAENSEVGRSHQRAEARRSNTNLRVGNLAATGEGSFSGGVYDGASRLESQATPTLQQVLSRREIPQLLHPLRVPPQIKNDNSNEGINSQSPRQSADINGLVIEASHNDRGKDNGENAQQQQHLLNTVTLAVRQDGSDQNINPPLNELQSYFTLQNLGWENTFKIIISQQKNDESNNINSHSEAQDSGVDFDDADVEELLEALPRLDSPGFIKTWMGPRGGVVLPIEVTEFLQKFPSHIKATEAFLHLPLAYAGTANINVAQVREALNTPLEEYTPIEVPQQPFVLVRDVSELKRDKKTVSFLKGLDSSVHFVVTGVPDENALMNAHSAEEFREVRALLDNRDFLVRHVGPERIHAAGKEDVLKTMGRLPQMGSVAAFSEGVHPDFPARSFSEAAKVGGFTLRLNTTELYDAGIFGVDFSTPAVRSLIQILGQATKEQARDIFGLLHLEFNARGEVSLGLNFVNAVAVLYAQYRSELRTTVSA